MHLANPNVFDVASDSIDEDHISIARLMRRHRGAFVASLHCHLLDTSTLTEKAYALTAGFSTPTDDIFVSASASSSTKKVSASFEGVSAPASASTRTKGASAPTEEVYALAGSFIPSLVKPLHCPPFKGQKVITTNVGNGKLPPNVPDISIDGVSFHSEDSVHK